MTSAGLSGIGAHRPANRVGNDVIARRLDSSDDWIRERSGIVTRGVAGPDETVVDMAISAGGKALAAAGVDPASVGLVMVATCTLTHAVPGAAARVASGLNLTNAGAFDIGAACAGFTYGLALAADSVRCASTDVVLVIGSEKFS